LSNAQPANAFITPLPPRPRRASRIAGEREEKIANNANNNSLTQAEDISRWLGQVGRDIFGEDAFVNRVHGHILCSP
jgi:hypothetical protein